MAGVISWCMVVSAVVLSVVTVFSVLLPSLLHEKIKLQPSIMQATGSRVLNNLIGYILMIKLKHCKYPTFLFVPVYLFLNKSFLGKEKLEVEKFLQVLNECPGWVSKVIQQFLQ